MSVTNLAAGHEATTKVKIPLSSEPHYFKI